MATSLSSGGRASKSRYLEHESSKLTQYWYLVRANNFSFLQPA